MREVRAGQQLAETAADLIAQQLGDCLRDKPRASLALSGGSTPWPVFRLLADAPLDWHRVDIYQVDERVAPLADPARNLTGLTEALLDRVPATVHPMPVDEPDLRAAAMRYEAELPDALDVVHLGLGEDGHTASLVPNDPVLEVTDRRVAMTRPYRGHRRMTLTYPAFDSAGFIIWIVAGAEKTSMIRRLCNGDQSIPAGRVAQDNAALVTDAT
jgi:6-phosphogluconolactonase